MSEFAETEVPKHLTLDVEVIERRAKLYRH